MTIFTFYENTIAAAARRHCAGCQPALRVAYTHVQTDLTDLYEQHTKIWSGLRGAPTRYWERERPDAGQPHSFEDTRSLTLPAPFRFIHLLVCCPSKSDQPSWYILPSGTKIVANIRW
jgi:hypothetical protein